MSQLELLIHHGPAQRRLAIAPPGEALTIGRSPDAQASINDPSVAYEHAVIRTTDVGALIENLASNGTSLNGRRLQRPEALAAGDEVRLSETVWMQVLASEGGAKRGAQNVPLMVVTLLLTLGAGAWILLCGKTSPPRSYVAAFSQLEGWLETQAASERVPREVVVTFREAWRLESAGQFTAAERAWARAGVIASVCAGEDGSGTRRSWSEWASEHPDALDGFLVAKATDAVGDDASHAAAVVQFAAESAGYAGRRAKEKATK